MKIRRNDHNNAISSNLNQGEARRSCRALMTAGSGDQALTAGWELGRLGQQLLSENRIPHLPGGTARSGLLSLEARRLVHQLPSQNRIQHLPAGTGRSGKLSLEAGWLVQRLTSQNRIQYLPGGIARSRELFLEAGGLCSSFPCRTGSSACLEEQQGQGSSPLKQEVGAAASLAGQDSVLAWTNIKVREALP